MISKLLEFKIKGEEWSDELLDKGSQKYTQLKNRVNEAVSHFKIMLYYLFERPESVSSKLF